MRAIIHATYGPPDGLRLEDRPVPTPAPGEALVQVRAASIFAGDKYALRGRPFMVRFATGLRRPRHLVPGMDLAGVVQAVGAGVTTTGPGDAVFGWTAGSLAELAIVPAAQLVAKPARLSFEEAAAVPEAAVTALQALRDQGRVGPGMRVLVIGASGGVGTFAVQIASALGAEVTGVCSPRNLELVRSIGATHAIDYTRQDPVESGPYDVILQAAGTDSPRRLRRALAPGGTLVLCCGEGRLNGVGRILLATLLDPFVTERLKVFVTRENRADLLAVAAMLEDGRIRPVIDRTYPLAETTEAFRHLEAGHTRGKIVIAI